MKIIKIINWIKPLQAVLVELWMQWKFSNNPNDSRMPTEINSYPELAAYFGPFLRDCM